MSFWKHLDTQVGLELWLFSLCNVRTAGKGLHIRALLAFPLYLRFPLLFPYSLVKCSWLLVSLGHLFQDANDVKTENAQVPAVKWFNVCIELRHACLYTLSHF